MSNGVTLEQRGRGARKRRRREDVLGIVLNNESEGIGGGGFGESLGALHNPAANSRTNGAEIHGFALGAQWTLECFAFLFGNFSTLHLSWGGGFPSDQIELIATSNGAAQMDITANSRWGGADHITSGTSGVLSTTVPFHFAAANDATTLRAFVNGVQLASIATTFSFVFPSSPSGVCYIDVYNDVAAFGSTYAKAREYRISSIARYTSNFTPPDALGSLGADANTIHYWRCREGTGTTANDSGNFPINLPLGSNSPGGIWHPFTGVYV